MRTDASGRYTIEFASNPWRDGITGSRGAARAEVVADDYEWYWRTVIVGPEPHLNENFRLHRLQRVTAGDSIAILVTLDNGSCTGWLADPCGRLRVVPLASGNLTVEAVPVQLHAGLPELQVCCAQGSERYGNPVTLPVTVGTETWVEIGQQRPGFTADVSFMVKTALAPF